MNSEAIGVQSRTVDILQHYLLLVASGDRAAFALLYDGTVAPVSRVVRRMLIDPSQSEEVTQEVFLEIWQTAARYQPDRGGALSWMLMVARRRAIDRVRASQSSRERDVRIGVRNFDPEYDSVAEHAETRSESARVHLAMRELTTLQREAVRLAYVDEFSYPEISARLQIPIGTVKTRIRDGILRLRSTVNAVT